MLFRSVSQSRYHSAVGTAVFVVAAVVVVVGVVAVFVVVVVDGRGHSVSVGNLGIDVLLNSSAPDH